ncbi:MAG: NAD(P)H-dependent oxidoreductase [Sphaerochaetaceae bacterium]
MNRVSIIIHSINGNCFIMGDHLKKLLEERKVEVRLYKVKDEDLHIQANKSEAANEYYEDILDLPTVKNEKLLKSKIIVLSSPSVFSNITAEMTDFLDNTKEFIEKDSLKGKLFTCFTSSQKDIEDGEGCIKAMENWSKAMKMEIIEDLPKIIHISGDEGRIRPSVEIAKQLEKMANKIEEMI